MVVHTRSQGRIRDHLALRRVRNSGRRERLWPTGDPDSRIGAVERTPPTDAYGEVARDHGSEAGKRGTTTLRPGGQRTSGSVRDRRRPDRVRSSGPGIGSWGRRRPSRRDTEPCGVRLCCPARNTGTAAWHPLGSVSCEDLGAPFHRSGSALREVRCRRREHGEVAARSVPNRGGHGGPRGIDHLPPPGRGPRTLPRSPGRPRISRERIPPAGSARHGSPGEASVAGEWASRGCRRGTESRRPPARMHRAELRWPVRTDFERDRTTPLHPGLPRGKRSESNTNAHRVNPLGGSSVRTTPCSSPFRRRSRSGPEQLRAASRR